MKKPGFRSFITINVSILYILFTLLIFFLFIKFYSKNYKNNIRKENIYSIKVGKDFLEEELKELGDKVKYLKNDEKLSYAFTSKKYIKYPRTGSGLDPKVTKLNKLKIKSLASELLRRITGKRGHYKEYHMELFDVKLRKQASIGGFSKSILDSESSMIVQEAFKDEKDYYTRHINTFIAKGDKLMLKSVSNLVGGGRNFGVLTLSREFGNYFLSEMKNRTGKEILLIKNGHIVQSTYYNETKMYKDVEIDISGNDLNKIDFYFEKEILGKKYGFNVFPMKSYKNETLAYFALGFSLSGVEVLYKNSIKQLSVYIIVFTFFMFLIVYVILRIIFRPFNKIIEGIGYIGKGEYDKKIELRSMGELELLKNIINELAEKIQKREMSLKESNLRLMELDKLKDEFLANTSHELRTPLNGIIGIAESLVDGACGVLTKLQNYNLSLIVSSGRRLSNLINDILDFSKIKKKDLNIVKQEVDLKAIINEVIQISKLLTMGKKLEIINNFSDDIPNILCDQDRIKQVFHNLIGNAIKFTDEGFIRIKSELENDNKLRITVRDTGVGIEKKDFEKIFRSFEQVDGSEVRAAGGTGLGLSITKQIIEMHGGEIWVESEVGRGSSFIFEIPLEKSNVDNDIKQIFTKESTESTNKDILSEDFGYMTEIKKEFEMNKDIHILVADDEPVNLQVIINNLSNKNYSVVTALNGQEAMRLLEEYKFDLVLLDVMMPKMSGFEVCKKIRDKYTLLDMPVLMITAKNQITDIVTGFESGANDYVNKPFSKKELLARVNTLLELRKAVKSSIESAGKLEKVKIQRDTINKINEFITVLGSSLELDNVLTSLIKWCKTDIEFDNVFCYVDNNGKLDLTYTLIEGNKIEVDGLIRSRISDFLSKDEKNVFSIECEYKTLLLLPILTKDKKSGFIAFLKKNKIEYSSEKIESIRSYLNQAGFALDNARLFNIINKQTKTLKENVKELKSIEKFLSVIYKENEIEYVLYYIMNILGLKYLEREKEIVYYKFEEGGEDVNGCMSFKNSLDFHDLEKGFLTDFEDVKKYYLENKTLLRDASEKYNIKINRNKLSLLKGAFNKNRFLDIEKSDKFGIEVYFEGEKKEKGILLSVNFENDIFGMFYLEEIKTEINTELAEKTKDFLNIFSNNLSIYLENKKLENDNIKNHKLDSIVQLARSIVHEIRTPIAVIKGFSSIEKKKTFEKESIKRMDIIINETDRIDGIALDLLEYSGQEDYMMKYEKTNLKELIKGCIEIVKADLEVNGIKLKTDKIENIIVNIDEEKFEKVVKNIIKNAIEAVDVLKDERYLEITLKKDEDKFKLVVEDNGLGVKESIKDTIYEPLVSTKIQGTGLGLSISKMIIEKMKGTIEIESEVKKYTKVIIKM